MIEHSPQILANERKKKKQPLVAAAARAVTEAAAASRNGELRTQKLKSHLVRTQRLNVLPLKPGVGQYIACLLYTSPSPRDRGISRMPSSA